MSELTEASLEAMLIEIRKHLDETGDRVSLIPTQLILRPSDLEALGLTVDDVIKMIKEQNMAWPFPPFPTPIPVQTAPEKFNPDNYEDALI